MEQRLRDRVLPSEQRRTIRELTNELDLTDGDSTSKRSAFWTMLALSGIIATAGVLADSTATVIGAMIIAPLSTPIMGIALSIVKGKPNGSIRFVVGGTMVVVLTGVLFAVILPGSVDLHGNTQISGRTSPGILDLVAAVATGFAGAIALARRDVGAVLPGVAIAISLVPPLAVAGVCLGEGAVFLAGGAFVLFLSNILALVLAGVLVFTVIGYASEGRPVRATRRTKLTLGLLMAVVLVPLVSNTAAAYLLSIWTAQVEESAESWLAEVPGSTVTDVELKSNTFHVDVLTAEGIPPVEDLADDLSSELPSGFGLVVSTNLGEVINGGTIGD